MAAKEVFSPLARMDLRIPDGGRSEARKANPTGFGTHQHAGVDAMGEATNPNRVVSANYWISLKGLLIPQISENRRAWTSGHPDFPAGRLADFRNITFEISNTPAGFKNKTWEISNESLATYCNAMGEISARRQMGPIVRGANRGVGNHDDWVNTNCPGPYMKKHQPALIDMAETIRRSYLNGKPALAKPSDIAKIVKGSPAAPKPPATPPAKPKNSRGQWPDRDIPVTGTRTNEYHKAWEILLWNVGYRDPILTTNFERWLKNLGYYKGIVEADYGLVPTFGPWLIDALQRKLADDGLYTGLFDAFTVPYARARGPETVKAEKRYLNNQRNYPIP